MLTQGEETQSNNDIEEQDEEEEFFNTKPEILYEEFFNYFTLSNSKQTWNVKECKNAMRCLGIWITEKEICENWSIKAKTGKEQINWQTFISLCNENQEKDNTQDLMEAFALYDPESTGYVNANKLKHAMVIFKPRMTDEEISQVLSNFGIDKNGNINYKDYLESKSNTINKSD